MVTQSTETVQERGEPLQQWVHGQQQILNGRLLQPVSPAPFLYPPLTSTSNHTLQLAAISTNPFGVNWLQARPAQRAMAPIMPPAIENYRNEDPDQTNTLRPIISSHPAPHPTTSIVHLTGSIRGRNVPGQESTRRAKKSTQRNHQSLTNAKGEESTKMRPQPWKPSESRLPACHKPCYVHRGAETFYDHENGQGGHQAAQFPRGGTRGHNQGLESAYNHHYQLVHNRLYH